MKLKVFESTKVLFDKILCVFCITKFADSYINHFQYALKAFPVHKTKVKVPSEVVKYYS